jgi:hypothetical protein
VARPAPAGADNLTCVCRRSASFAFLSFFRHCERSEAIQCSVETWIASSLSLLTMTGQNAQHPRCESVLLFDNGIRERTTACAVMLRSRLRAGSTRN